MLGVMLGLRAALQHRDLKRVVLWLGMLMVYPVLMLLFGGFLSLWKCSHHSGLFGTHDFDAQLLARDGRYHHLHLFLV